MIDPSLPPFDYLKALSQHAVASQQCLPSLIEPAESLWSGVGFVLAGHRCVVPMGGVSEVLAEPMATRVPGAKNWLKGVANVRGKLLPLIDMAAFLGLEGASSRHRRVLVCERGDYLVGLLVDDILGMQYFQRSAFFDGGDKPEALEKFIQGGYRDSGQVEAWWLFQISRLFDDAEFTNAAA